MINHLKIQLFVIYFFVLTKNMDIFEIDPRNEMKEKTIQPYFITQELKEYPFTIHQKRPDSFDLIIPLKTIVQKNLNSQIKNPKQLLDSLANVKCLWECRVNIQESQSYVNLEVYFLKNGRFSSLLTNSSFDNIRDLSQKVNDHFERGESWIHVKIPENTMDDFIKCSVTYNKKQNRYFVRMMLKKIVHVCVCFFQANYEGQLQNGNDSADSLFETRKRCKLLNPEISCFNFKKLGQKKPPKNIRYIEEADLQNLERTIDTNLSTRSEIRFLKVKKLELTDYISIDKDDSTQSENNRNSSPYGQLCLKSPKLHFQNDGGNTISYVQHEVTNYNYVKEIIRHPNLASIFLYPIIDEKYRFREEIYSPYYSEMLLEAISKKSIYKKEDFKEILVYTLQIISVLVYLQTIGLIMIDLKESNIMLQRSKTRKNIKIIDYAGYVNLKDPQNRPSQRVRMQFSTGAYTYKENGVVDWNHPKFDMFGLGKVLQKLFPLKGCIERELSTNHGKFYPQILELIQHCMRKPSEIQFTYSELYGKFQSLQNFL